MDSAFWNVGNIAAIIGIVIALSTLAKGVFEYIKQGTQKRAEYFYQLRRALKENAEYREILDLAETDDSRLAIIPFRTKRDLLGYFEEVALAVNSGLLKERVAHYMFGYYAIRIWESKHFWNDVSRESLYWSAFRDFVERMIALEKNFTFDRNDLRF